MDNHSNDVKLPDINDRASSQPHMKRKGSFTSGFGGAAKSAAIAKKERKE